MTINHICLIATFLAVSFSAYVNFRRPDDARFIFIAVVILSFTMGALIVSWIGGV